MNSDYKISNLGSLWKLLVRNWLLIISICASLSSCDNPQKSNSEKINFNFQVRPILSDKCFACHGPDDNARKADIRFDREEYAFLPVDTVENTFAIVPGNPEKSLLVNRIYHEDPEEVMPPPESNLSLTENEREILVRWIEEGAEWQEHWAFEPPVSPQPPVVIDRVWPSNSIDNFILKKIEQSGLKPAPEASPEKLIRRLSFDLRGIPPSAKEIEDFVTNYSDEAYNNLVDKFLNSKHYGERMTLDWLDLARYADSHGYQDDIERSMWPWRDWVIRSFNKNMPYDSFLILQMAGDLLPNATYEQKLATGFNRNHMITQEVGVIDEEYRMQYVVDRVNTVSTGVMGVTMECARCHDHKYDPFSQKEYYQLYDFFNRVPERGRVDYGVEVANPSLQQPDSVKQKLIAKIDGLVDNQVREIEKYRQDKWVKFKENPIEKGVLQPAGMGLPEGLISYLPLDYQEDDMLIDVVNTHTVNKGKNNLVFVKGKYSGGLEFSGHNYFEIDNRITPNLKKSFSINMWIKSLYGGIRGPLIRFVNLKEGKPDAFEINIDNNKRVKVVFRGKNPKNAIVMLTNEPLPADQWIQLTITYDGKGNAEGIEVFFDNQLKEQIVTQNNFNGIPLGYSHINVGRAKAGKGLMSGQIDELMFFDHALSLEEQLELKTFNPLLNTLGKDEISQKRLLSDFLFSEDSIYRQMTQWLAEFKIRQVRTGEVITAPTMIMEDIDTLRNTYILKRGQYDAPGEMVSAGTPKDILPFTEEFDPNRLGLAKWLVHPDNPLTARVAVNRYWQVIFGRGIVATPEDFGSQGGLPSHPGLLDWLSVEFMESGWNVKKLMKLIVTSSTYKQATISTDEKNELDPDNELISFRSKQRLQAEFIRDHGLTISGLLNDEIGGPSVKPYQPEGLWLETASGNQSLRKYIQDHRGDLYRKSMYTFWKRTVPFPSMMIFDASERGQCIVKRQSTTTPLQALVLLNDPQYLEISRMLAFQMLEHEENNPSEQIKYGFRLATSRYPDSDELKTLEEFYNDQLGEYVKEKHAENILLVGEYRTEKKFEPKKWAAMTVVANTIMNLTETISKN